MAIFLHQGPSLSLLKLSSISVSVSLLCLFLSWASSTTPPFPPPTSTPSAAAETLRKRGYALFAAAIDAAATNTNLLGGWNGTGTLFASPDFAFSYTTAKFKNGRAPPRPTTSLLYYHTLRQTLRWEDLKVRPAGEAFLTFFPRRCIFVAKNPAEELCLTGRMKTAGEYIRIRHPDLYVDENLIVHGVDGVLDPFSASKCPAADASDQTAVASSPRTADFSYLDHAIRALRHRGYGVVATAMAMRQSVLMRLTAVTIFAPSDESLFSHADGFRYDFRYHVIPRRLRLPNLATIPDGTEIGTLVPGESVVVKSVDGAVVVNGVEIDNLEIYHNGWVVILAVSRPLQINPAVVASANSPVVSQDSGNAERIVSPPTAEGQDYSDPDHRKSSEDSGDVRLAPMIGDLAINGADSPDSDDFVVTSTAPASFSEHGEENLAGVWVDLPLPSTSASVSGDIRCSSIVPPLNGNGAFSALSVGLESYCPMTLIGPRVTDVAPPQSSVVTDQIQGRKVQSAAASSLQLREIFKVPSTSFPSSDSRHMAQVDQV